MWQLLFGINRCMLYRSYRIIDFFVSLVEGDFLLGRNPVSVDVVLRSGLNQIKSVIFN